MDFSSFPTGGIDFSPSPVIRSTTLVLEDPELATAEVQQFERFWRVWHTDRAKSAPFLKMVTLVLRPGFVNGKTDYTGIHRFMAYYKNNVEPGCKTTGLQIYADNWTALVGDTRYNFAPEPSLLISKPVKRA